MRILELKVADLKEYGRNPRKNDKAVEPVAESIKQFGFKVPIIVDSDYVIIAGHTRLKAAKYLGLDVVPCVIADDLTEEQIKAFRLADNKVSEFAEWDMGLLDMELEGILDMDMEIFGFASEEDKEPTIEAEVPFTESLDESHNYVVLYFDNDIDWLQAQTVFNIGKVKELSTRKDGNGKSQNKGIGRVLNGADALNAIIGVS